MASGDVARILRGPGRVVVNPTSLSAAYPYGGTEIGLTRLCVLKVLGENLRVMSEGLGEATDVTNMETHWVFSCIVRGWDDDVVRLLQSDHYAAGSVSGHALFSVPGSTVPGASLLSAALKVLYVPDDVVHVPALIIYRGVADWSDGAEIAFQRRDEIGLPLAIDCIRDTSNRILKVGMLADLTL